MQPKSLTDLDTLLLQSQQWRKPDARTLEVFATQLARARAAIADDLAAANARAEAAEAANARCREANILLANSRNTAAEEWRTRAEAAEA
jgi:hypothetical protein